MQLARDVFLIALLHSGNGQPASHRPTASRSLCTSTVSWLRDAIVTSATARRGFAEESFWLGNWGNHEAYLANSILAFWLVNSEIQASRCGSDLSMSLSLSSSFATAKMVGGTQAATHSDFSPTATKDANVFRLQHLATDRSA